MPRVDDTPYDLESYELGPWTETPSSSRVSRFRYDYSNQVLQVQWRNQKNEGYIYGGDGMGYESYRSFARAVSKGKKVNTLLNAFQYRPMSSEEANAPSNANRKGLRSRVQT